MPAVFFLDLPTAGATKTPVPAATRRQLRRDDLVSYDGRAYHVRGWDPISVIPARVYLEDVETREPRSAALKELLDLCETDHDD